MCFKNALERLTNAKIHFDVPMKKHTSFGVGGCARYYAEIDSLFSLNLLISLAKDYKVKYKVIGNGTNILVSDLGYDGVIIDIKNQKAYCDYIHRICDMQNRFPERYSGPVPPTPGSRFW